MSPNKVPITGAEADPPSCMKTLSCLSSVSKRKKTRSICPFDVIFHVQFMLLLYLVAFELSIGSMYPAEFDSHIIVSAQEEVTVA